MAPLRLIRFPRAASLGEAASPVTPDARAAHNQRVNDYFDQSLGDYRHVWGLDAHRGMHAAFYDARHRTHAAAIVNLNRVVADAAGIRAGERVLDAGCGVGGTALWLAHHRAAEVVGININATQIEMARRQALADGLTDRARFEVADYLATGLPDAAFDVVVAVESACYAPDKADFCREARRLLRPGGRLVVVDVFLRRPPADPRETAMLAAWCGGWAVPNVPTVADFTDLLTTDGFSDVRFRDCAANVRPTSRHMLALALAMWWPALFLQWLGLRTAVQNGNIVAGYHQYAIGRRGLGVYGIFTATARAG